MAMKTLHDIPVNRQLLWDYTFSEKDIKTESFLKWYIGRVLTNGTAKDIKKINLQLIGKYLPFLAVPRGVADFWQWYFDYVYHYPFAKNSH